MVNSTGLSPDMLLLLAVTSFVFGLAFFIGTPAGRGWLGEKILHHYLTRRLPKGLYQVVSDVTLPTEDGTTQIDHVVLSPNGVFVIETKTFAAWVFVHPENHRWRWQYFRSEHWFQSPLKQNEKHVEAIKALTGLPSGSIHSLIAFAATATLKGAQLDNVRYFSGAADYILAQQEQQLSDAQVAVAAAAIEHARLPRGFRTLLTHHRNTRKKLVDTRETSGFLVAHGLFTVLCFLIPASLLFAYGIASLSRPEAQPVAADKQIALRNNRVVARSTELSSDGLYQRIIVSVKASPNCRHYHRWAQEITDGVYPEAEKREALLALTKDAYTKGCGNEASAARQSARSQHQ